MSPTPTDPKLYQLVKEDVYRRIPKHSAYRSGILVKEYKEKFSQLYPNESPYLEKEKPKNSGLTRWFKEKWTNQRGDVGYQKPGDIYRPNVIVNENTPLTFGELTDEEIYRARKEKLIHGRVSKFGE